jgi:hypothetical protein
MKRVLALLIATMFSLSSYADFGVYASAVYLNVNGNGEFYNTLKPGNTQDITNVDFTGDLGTFENNSGLLKLNGAEIKSYKNGGNVCSGTIFYRIYADGSTPGAFNSINLPFYSACTGSSCNGFPNSFDYGGGCCNPDDQKWQQAAQQIDLTAYPSGKYVLEVYYTITGDGSSTSGCGSTAYDTNNSNNYKVTYTITNQLPVIFGKIEAYIKKDALLINWATVKETDVSHYNILASFNGSNFTKIGQIESLAPNGNSNTTLVYSFSKNLTTNQFYLYIYALLGFASIAALFKRKTKISLAVALCAIGIFVISCSRDNNITPSPLSKIYVKIVQIDKYGKELDSKVVKAIDE